jgi:hypothetical protein
MVVNYQALMINNMTYQWWIFVNQESLKDSTPLLFMKTYYLPREKTLGAILFSKEVMETNQTKPMTLPPT